VSLLDLRDLTHYFGGLRAVGDVNIRLMGGELLGLIGPNGAGKTTIFNLICGVYQPSEGEIFFQGKSLAGLRPHAIARKGIARTFQNIRLWNNMTVLENLMLAQHGRLGYNLGEIFLGTGGFRQREREIEHTAREIMEILNINELADELPKNLPYGIQRRVEIGRALALEPKLLLLDEPAAGLNAGEVTDLMDLIRFIQREFDVTVFMIEHDMKVVMGICSWIQVLDFGEIIAEGTAEEIKRNERVIAAYLGDEVHH